MANRIIVLDELTSNQIAAGEVVERPASVIKELVENSIDAGADRIDISIRSGGIKYIKISDNGTGIAKEDIAMAFERHGTSKIRTAKDLQSVATMGFRGEALPSIAAVSKVSITTKTDQDEFAIIVVQSGGDILSTESAARAQGTTVEVENLFFNMPARYKFLKNDSQEARNCIDTVQRLALANPHIAFNMLSDNKEVLRTVGDGNFLNCIYSLYGKEIAQDLFEVNEKTDEFLIEGYISNAFSTRGNRSQQNIFVNNRYVKYFEISKAVENGYDNRLMKGRFPFFFIKLTVPAHNLDVNVHPSKIEVKISNIYNIASSITYIIKNTLGKVQSPMQTIDIRPSYSKQVNKDDIQALSKYDKMLKDFSLSIQQSPIQDSLPESTDNEQIHIYEDKQDKQDKQDKLSNDSNSGVTANDKGQDNAYYIAIEQEYAKNVEHNVPLKDRPYIILGQVMSTYIVVNIYDGMILIDQHAAHEKIFYEQMKAQYDDRNMLSQQLMITEELVLTSSEMDYVLENHNVFVAYGFDFTASGPNSILIRQVPAMLSDADIVSSFKSVLDNLLSDNPDSKYDALYSMACKAAVKANKQLDIKQMEYIYKTLLSLENPFNCPHGRPTMILLNRNEMDKLFKRIV